MCTRDTIKAVTMTVVWVSHTTSSASSNASSSSTAPAAWFGPFVITFEFSAGEKKESIAERYNAVCASEQRKISGSYFSCSIKEICKQGSAINLCIF